MSNPRAPSVKAQCLKASGGYTHRIDVLVRCYPKGVASVDYVLSTALFYPSNSETLVEDVRYLSESSRPENLYNLPYSLVQRVSLDG